MERVKGDAVMLGKPKTLGGLVTSFKYNSPWIETAFGSKEFLYCFGYC
jgi:hypothetical protein